MQNSAAIPTETSSPAAASTDVVAGAAWAWAAASIEPIPATSVDAVIIICSDTLTYVTPGAVV